MASAVVSDVVTDISRHPYAMVDAVRSPDGASSGPGSSSQHPPSSYQQHRATTSSSGHRHSSSLASDQASRPAPAASAAINIPQASQQHRHQSTGTDGTDESDLFSRGHRPPQHAFDATQAYEQAQQHGSRWQTNARGPQAATVAATGAAHGQGGYRSQSGSTAGSAQHSANPSQSSAPPSTPPSPRLLPTIRSTLSMSGNTSPARIKVRDLNHIQSFASEELLHRASRNPSSRNLRGAATGRADEGGGQPGSPTQTYDIAQMPVTDIIEMVAGLLTKMTSTNDKAHEKDVNKHIPNLQDAAAAAAAGVNAPPAPSRQPSSSASGQAASGPQAGGYLDVRGMHRQTQSVLSFHGKNVPSISILMYLSRIHKYCPTTYEVFLSLLVYFDRMTENINRGVVHSFRNMDPDESAVGSPPPSRHQTERLGTEEALHKGEEERAGNVGVDVKPPIMHPFVVDSFNIHRLIMAGVTCASKFFSDVFYTNSRYAKVGGLPLAELNHLELQFLLLNDFKLFIPIEELEYYGSLLVEFYAEEILTQQLKDKKDREEKERREREEGNTDGSEEGDEGVHMKEG